MKMHQIRLAACGIVFLLVTVSFLSTTVAAKPQEDTPEEQPPLELNATLDTKITKPQYENLTRSMNEDQQRFQAKYLEKRKNCGAAPDPFASLPPSNRTISSDNGSGGGGGIDLISFTGILIKGELFKPRNCDS